MGGQTATVRFKKMESSSSSNTPLEGKNRKLEPEWLERFLEKTFFDSCSEHPVRRNELNKYCIDCDTSLCQHCPVAPHKDHILLKLYRHVYKDVAPLDEIKRYIDCSQIQPYRCNKQLVIALTPLPSKKTDDKESCQTCKRKLMQCDLYSYCSISCKVKAFTKKEDDDSPPFLSLDLLVQNSNQRAEPRNTAVDQLAEKGEQETEPKKMTLDQLAEQAEQEIKGKKIVDRLEDKAEQETEAKKTTEQESELKLVENANQEPKLSFRTRKRKGIPHRAPLF